MLKKYFNLVDVPIRGANDIDIYPRASERDRWEKLPEKTKQDVIAAAEPYLNYQWPSLLMMDYNRYYTEGSRDPYMEPYWNRRHILTTLVLAECMEHKGRFMPDIINGIYLVCQEMTWIDPAHNNHGRFDIEIQEFPMCPKDHYYIDLFSSATGAVMGWYYYLLKDELDAYSPEIRKYMKYSVEEKVINRYLATREHSWRTNRGNWNINCSGSVLTAASMVMDDKRKLRNIMEQVIYSTDYYLEGNSEDGGSDEGASYWHSNAGVIPGILRWLEYMTYGKIALSKSKQLKNMAAFLPNMYAGKNNYNNFSDSHMHMEADLNTEKAFMIGQLTGDENLMIIAARRGLAGPPLGNYWIPMYLESYFDKVGEKMAIYRDKPLHLKTSHWINSVQIAFFREKETAEGLYFSIKGNHNRESHNHLDVGNFVLHNDGDPVIMDAGIGEYTKATSFADRYTIWAMNSKYHNVPWIGGVEQKFGEEFRTGEVRYEEDRIVMDIAPAYGDESILRWIRDVRYDRTANEILFTETYEFTEEKEIDLHFMLTEPPVIADGCVKLPGGMALIHDISEVSYEEVENMDSRMVAYWGHVYRLKLRTRGKRDTIFYKFKKLNTEEK